VHPRDVHPPEGVGLQFHTRGGRRASWMRDASAMRWKAPSVT
jgi:hypothetical protein